MVQQKDNALFLTTSARKMHSWDTFFVEVQKNLERFTPLDGFSEENKITEISE
jgi:hypothetical protein